ncbi:MAG: lysostaphin resistance A-like protein [Acidimicrobiales bacterium]
MPGSALRPHPARLAVGSLTKLGHPEDPDSLGARGIGYAVAGFVTGYVVAAIFVAIWSGIRGLKSANGVLPNTLGTTVASLVGLWTGLVGAGLAASRRLGTGKLATDYGFRLRPWPDIPLGLAVGVASQYLLVPGVYLPLRLFVKHLDSRLGQPAHQLTSVAHGPGLIVLALFVCIGAPLVEELFFRGLLLRSLRARLGPVLAVVISGVAFGLAHAEALQLVGLAAFGIVLGILAERTKRLGSGMVAHATFNALAVIAIAVSR